MEDKNTPPPADIQAINKQIKSLQAILSSKTHKICIINDLDNGTREVLYFSSTAIPAPDQMYKPLPIAFLTFLEVHANYLTYEKAKLDANRPLVRYKSQVVFVDELIETLRGAKGFAGIKASIDQLKDMQPGQSVAVTIGNETIVLQKIS